MNPPRRVLNIHLWTPRQRITLASLTVLIAITFLLVATRRPLHINDPPLPNAPRAHELATRIDPNHADWPTLAALPQIGEKRAKQILAYRDDFTRKNPTRRPFTTIQDLQNVPGIGPATADALSPYLLFPNEPSPTPER